MKKHEIFETNPNLKEVHITSDGQAFYNDNDAKMHAKTLEDKKVELVLNPSFLSDIEVIDEEDLSVSDAPKLEDLTNAELVAFAKANFDLTLKVTTKKENLLKAIDAELAKEVDASTETLEVIDAAAKTPAETLEVIDATATAPEVDANKDQA